MFEFSACAEALVVTPEAIPIKHWVRATRATVAAVRVMVAVFVPEVDGAALKVVEPQPVVLGVAKEASVKPGNTIVIESPIYNGVLRPKMTRSGVGADVTALSSIRRLNVNDETGAVTSQLC